MTRREKAHVKELQRIVLRGLRAVRPDMSSEQLSQLANAAADGARSGDTRVAGVLVAYLQGAHDASEAERVAQATRRDLSWLCAGHEHKNGPVGDAARRLSKAVTFNDCPSADLELLIAKAWRVSRFGICYVSSLRCQGAALRLQEMLEKRSAVADAEHVPSPDAG